MWFQYYNVENRARVKCVSGKENVPVSTQWDPQGYYYPIQISQYGLSHYSMLVAEEKPKITVLENAEGAGINWAYTDSESYAKKVDSHLKYTQVLRFKTKGIELNTEGISLTVDGKPDETILSFHLKLTGESCISVTALVDHTNTYSLHYKSNMESLINRDGKDIFYSLGSRTHWSKITRDLVTDLQKGIGLTNTKNSRKVRFGVIKVQGIVLRGQGFMDNLTLSNTGHMDFFKAAADWLVANQDSKGGWPVQVKRVLLPEVVIKPGWYSAMGQGQAISLLTRAYSYFKDETYINAAVRATEVFTIPSKNNGIVAHFLGTIPWYEEYPTTPSLFVLNGFIYSLIGLYDLKMTAKGKLGDEAARLFHEGMNSLKTLLLLYDTGSGTFYDLRHISMKLAPNIARWDYHNVHCSQLHLLYTIDPDPFLKETMMRWRSYLKGQRAKHN